MSPLSEQDREFFNSKEYTELSTEGRRRKVIALRKEHEDDIIAQEEISLLHTLNFGTVAGKPKLNQREITRERRKLRKNS